jgi:hypothetical protein
MSEKVTNKINSYKKLPRSEARFMIFLFAISNVAAICVSSFVLNIPVVAVCTIAILEILLVNLLDRIPVWIHAVIIVLQAAAGFYVGKSIFMVLMAALYLVGLVIEIIAKKYDD